MNGLGCVRRSVPLAPLTTLELGGPAAALADVASTAQLRDVLRWAQRERLPATVMGGGSNLVVADQGFPGLVVRPRLRGLELDHDGDAALLRAAAGEPWDDVVAAAVEKGFAGLECLSGIPGLTGATPVQNVGAYGQEVADTVAAVRVLDRLDLEERTLSPEECRFGYRDSRLRRDPDRFVVLEVSFRLRAGGAPTLRYAELARSLAPHTATPELAAVREAVLELRRGKSMVLAPDDPNRRSVGSFFVNPVVTPGRADEAARRAVAAGELSEAADLPRFAAETGRVKLSAAWLVEHAGFPRGLRRGPVGLSSRHALALVHHGGGSTAELLALAADIRAAVRRRFGVLLRPEPVFLGFTAGDPLGPLAE